jgi:spore coat polysaccharide biosynthesis protein SpsF
VSGAERAVAGQPKPLVIVQARVDSSRLPGKVLADLCGEPLLGWLLDRVRASVEAEGAMVATTTAPEDDLVEELASKRGVACFRGHPTDVLARFASAMREAEADSIARISGDSPLIDAKTVDTVIEDFQRGGADLVENHRQPGWPVGTAVEVISSACLERLDRDVSDPAAREHVTLYAYEKRSGVRTRHVPPPAELRAPKLQLCVDTAKDLERVRRICSSFAPRRDFSVAEVVASGVPPA